MIKKYQNYRKKRNKKGSKTFFKNTFFQYNHNQYKTSLQGILYIQSTRNNLILSLTDTEGNVIFTSSSGIIGITGSKKRLSSNKLKIIERILSFLQKRDIRRISLVFRGYGADRESVCRNLQKAKLFINSIKDYESIAHNGCRLTKPKRL